MPVILNIETSATTCSVAVTANGMVLKQVREGGRNHASLLSGFIKECLDFLKENSLKPEAVAVSLGPGSYTGLRIGLSQAKGVAYSLGLPLIGVNTLELMAVAVMFSQDTEPDTLFVPMLDARRMEVYTAVYDTALNPLLPPGAMLLDEGSYSRWLGESKMLFFGNGSEKFKPLANHANARFVSGIEPLAGDMLALSEQAFAKNDFIDIAYSVPLYLKEIQATKPKKTLK